MSRAHPQDKALERAGEQRHSGKSRDCGRGKCNTLAYEQQFAKKLIQQFVEEQRRTNKQRNCGRGKCGDEQQSADEQMVLADQQQSQAQTHAEVQAQLERLAGKQQFASEQRHTGKSRDCSGRGKCTAQGEVNFNSKHTPLAYVMAIKCRDSALSKGLLQASLGPSLAWMLEEAFYLAILT